MGIHLSVIRTSALRLRACITSRVHMSEQTVQKKDFMDLMLRDKSGVRNVKYWG